MSDDFATTPATWYLSMCDGRHFIGSAMICAPSSDAALERAADLGILCGDQILVAEFPAGVYRPAPEYFDRLLPLSVVREAFAPDPSVRVVMMEVFGAVPTGPPAAAHSSRVNARWN